MADEILCDVQDNIATLTMNRPEKRNALNSTAIELLVTYLHDLETNPAVRVIVLRGAGAAFSAGRDLRELGQQQQSTDKPPPEITVHGQFAPAGHGITVHHGDRRMTADFE